MSTRYANAVKVSETEVSVLMLPPSYADADGHVNVKDVVPQTHTYYRNLSHEFQKPFCVHRTSSKWYHPYGVSPYSQTIGSLPSLMSSMRDIIIAVSCNACAFFHFLTSFARSSFFGASRVVISSASATKVSVFVCFRNAHPLQGPIAVALSKTLETRSPKAALNYTNRNVTSCPHSKRRRSCSICRKKHKRALALGILA